MKIFVKAKPSAKEAKVEKIDDTHFAVWEKEPPKNGRANWAIVRALAEYFGVSVSRIAIVSGHASRQKIVDIAS